MLVIVGSLCGLGSAAHQLVQSMIDMDMAATKTTLTAPFWLMRASTASLFLAAPYLTAGASRRRA